MYLKGYSIKSIADKFGVTYDTVKRCLSKNYNIVFDGDYKYKDLIPKIKEDYRNKMSMGEISKKYNISKSTVNNYLRFENEDIRELAEAIRNCEQDDNYFNELNEEKAYKLGILFKTSRVYEKINSRVIEIIPTNNEKIILDTIRAFTTRNNIVDTSDKGKSISIFSTPMYNDFVRYGIKSEELNIPKEYIDSFMRGYLNIAFCLNGKVLRISTDRPFKKSILDYVQNNLNFTYKTTRDGDFKIFAIVDVARMVNIYPDVLIEKISLYMKTHPQNEYWKAVLIEAEKQKSSDYIDKYYYRNCIEDMIKLYNEGYSSEKIGKIYNIASSTVRAQLKGKVKFRTSNIVDNEYEVYKMYLDGNALYDIADKLKCSYKTIKEFLSNEYNIFFDISSSCINELGLMKEDYKSGMSLKDIEKKYNIDVTHNYYLMRKITFKTNKFVDNGDEVYKMYLDGNTLCNMASELKSSYKTIKEFLSNEYNVVFDKDIINTNKLKLIKKDYKNGISLKDIEKKYNIDITHNYYLMKKLRERN